MISEAPFMGHIKMVEALKMPIDYERDHIKMGSKLYEEGS